MSLETWRANGWLVPHEASDEESARMLEAARRDLVDARKDISPAWRFAIAYNAALRVCTAALEAAGYRATRDQKHFRTIAALPLVLGPEAQDVADFLDACRAKRHEATYESLSGVTAGEADELVDAVTDLETRVRARLAR